MIDEQLRAKRLAVLAEHFASEVDREFDRTIATFAGTPRYEIIPTGQVHEGEDEVLAYHRAQRTAFPDQRHDGVTMHVADDDTVIAEFDLLGTNLGAFLGGEPTGQAFRVPTIAVFSFEAGGEGITNERVYLDLVSLLTQIGRTDLLPS
ncbi:SnoaL-like domain-containing protein [Iamia sp. SCSIO 61187]|uniref:ester cyclase n=1 Tax=Iamia sp. SCSIO 61187 TaxID=2722752 RepID=UPI001C634CA6|nr:ester cyclase [Iamia sp. SCSIO 61187]QYG95197.1 SnoaL-like domain-containing protein [Iamia sp. SCSIO 61187]